MSNKKYEFHNDLKAYANQKVPIIPAVLPFLQKLMSVLYIMEKSDQDVIVTSRKILSENGRSTRVLTYDPVNAKKNGPALLVMHGGGFAFQSAPHHFGMARRMAKALGYKTFFVDYRLAPKHKFPAAPDDCFQVYQWLISHAKELEIDCTKIGVCGDSAGGNLATVVCLMAKDLGIQMPKAQMLIYPFVDRRMETNSIKIYTDTPMCNSEDMKKYLQMYVKDVESAQTAYLSPIEAEELSGLPDTYIEVAEYDCLRDEGIAYGELLRQNSVNVEVHETFGAMHGYDIAEKSGLLKECMKNRVQFLKSTLQ